MARREAILALAVVAACAGPRDRHNAVPATDAIVSGPCVVGQCDAPVCYYFPPGGTCLTPDSCAPNEPALAEQCGLAFGPSAATPVICEAFGAAAEPSGCFSLTETTAATTVCPNSSPLEVWCCPFSPCVQDPPPPLGTLTCEAGRPYPPTCITSTDCDDQSDCTIDTCWEGSCSPDWMPNGTPCGDHGSFCHSGECCTEQRQ